MTAQIAVTPEDARKAQAVVDAFEATDPKRRTAHLAEWAADLARRVRAAFEQTEAR